MVGAGWADGKAPPASPLMAPFRTPSSPSGRARSPERAPTLGPLRGPLHWIRPNAREGCTAGTPFRFLRRERARCPYHGGVTVDRPEFRISDIDRGEAQDALGAHLSSGRLDIEEYAERTARAATAKTVRELAPLFADLPAPRPTILDAAPAPRANSRPEPVRAAWWTGGAVPVAAVLALLLFVTVARGFWPVFLIPAAVAVLVAAAGNGGGRGPAPRRR